MLSNILLGIFMLCSVVALWYSAVIFWSLGQPVLAFACAVPGPLLLFVLWWGLSKMAFPEKARGDAANNISQHPEGKAIGWKCDPIYSEDGNGRDQ